MTEPLRLPVRVLANGITGLAKTDTFAFGSLVGETGDDPASPRVTAADVTNVRLHFNSASDVSGPYDFDRDGRVTSVDVMTARRNLSAQLPPVVWNAPVPATQGVVPIRATDWLDDE